MSNGNGKRNGKRNGGQPAPKKKGKAPAKKKRGKQVTPREPVGSGVRSNPIKKPTNRPKALETAYLYLRGEDFKRIAKLANVGLRTFDRWRECDWWWDMVENEADRSWFQELKVGAKRTVGIQALDPERGEAFRVVERLDDRLAPPKQRIELTTNYLHRDTVLELFRGFAEDLVEVVTDPEQRDELVRRAEKRFLPMTGEQKQLAAGDPEE